MKTKGFTMVSDVIVQKYGALAGLVYGKIARYCEWSDLDVCTASNKRLASELGMGESTVRKYKKLLVDDDYIIITGKTGDTNTVRVIEEMVLSLETPLPESGGVATRELGGSLSSSDKESIIKKVLKEKEQPTLFNTFYGTKPPKVDSTWFPADVKEYLMVFNINFKIRFKREATKGERGYWIRECREWLKRGYSVQNVQNAWQHCVDSDTTISSPRSITWAFDQLEVDDEIYSEEM